MEQGEHAEIQFMQVPTPAIDDKGAVRHRAFNHRHPRAANDMRDDADLYRFRSRGEKLKRLPHDGQALGVRHLGRQCVRQAFEQPLRKGLHQARLLLLWTR